MKNIWPLLLVFLSFQTGFTQPTLSVLQYTDNAMEGYTFFSPFSGTKSYLIDNCGNLINEWDHNERPGLAAYFEEDGLVLRTAKPAPAGPFTSASNSGALELVNWENELIWRGEFNTADWISHHDAIRIPNGNMLVLTWQLEYRDSLIAWGRNPNEISTENYMWSERIIEIEPIGQADYNIVWEWQIKDHYIQDLDSTKVNFGIISEHPELFDINLPDLNSSNSNATRDWNHFNAIDYNPDLDQIVISVRNSDEIWIIDHSTTTEEAAGHTGGIYGKGGDILYRWGNASSYRRAPINDQKLFGQHGVHWIKPGLKDEGKIIMYNNGNGRPGNDYSTIEILDPPQSTSGHYIIPESEAIGPNKADIVYGDQLSERFYSPFLSNPQLLANGNTLINEGSNGRIFEIDENRNIVWEYLIPLFGDFPATQGSFVGNNSTFRAYKYSPNYSGLMNQDLAPSDPIENNPLPCNIITSENNISAENYSFKYNSEFGQFDFDLPIKEFNLMIYNVMGQKIVDVRLHSKSRFSLPQYLEDGIYIIVLHDNAGIMLKQKMYLSK